MLFADKDLPAKLHRVSRITSSLVFVTASLIFLGWLIDGAAVQSFFPGTSPITAINFMLVSAALWLLLAQPASLLARLLAGLAVLISVLKVSEFVFGIDLGIDHLVFLAPLASQPKLFALNTALDFILVGLAFLFCNSAFESRVKLSQLYLLAAGLIALLPLMGDIYGRVLIVPSTNDPYMALTTSLLFLLLCLGALFIQLERGYTAIITYDTAGGMMARRLLPAAILLPILFDVLRLLGRRVGLYDAEIGIALFVSLSIIALVIVIVRYAGAADRAERAQKKAEADLLASESRYRALFKYSSNAILLFNEQGQYLDANPEAEHLTGYSHDEILTRKVGEFAVEPDAGQTAFAEIIKQGQLKTEYTLARKDGSQVLVEFFAAAIEPGVYQTIFHDISEHQELRENLRRSLEQERELNELKTRFVSMISHDFRTPLSAIQLSSDILLNHYEDMEAPKRQRRLENIQLQIVYLSELLDNILIVGKAQMVGLHLQKEQQNLQEFCADLVDEFRLIAPNHEIIFNSSGNCSDVEVDSRLLRQAVTNLLSNAIKYSPARQPIVVDLACSDAEIVLSVQDHGIGIPEADQKHLFEFFHRAENVGDISGTGLGLSIVKQAVDAHGGSIQVSSLINTGTTFIIHLPRSQPA
ncbi:MAG: PAS domain S-box protein [Chloroflexi bacterium]|nr:PAS domain S-box protein [Chloroflexota bacterium]